MKEEDIKESIKKLYPSGKLEERNCEGLLKGDYLNCIYNVLNELASRDDVKFVQRGNSLDDIVFSFIVTLKGDPDYNEWFSFSDAERTEWLKWTNRNYPALWFVFSRACPVYNYHFESYTSGEFQVIISSKTSEKLLNTFLEKAEELLKKYDIQMLNEDELLEEVDFVKEEYFDENPYLDLVTEKLIPQYRNTTVYQCLFPYLSYRFAFEREEWGF